MATDNTHQAPALYTLNDLDYSDADSLASIETDDGQDHLPEKILAEFEAKEGQIWYLVSWTGCPVLRSSWEGYDIFKEYPHLFEAWALEKKSQSEGESQPFDIAAFNKAVFRLEEAERERRRLRRLKRKIQRVLSIVSD
jgi:hypothetical protein